MIRHALRSSLTGAFRRNDTRREHTCAPAPLAMIAPERRSSEDERVIGDALAVLRSVPALAGESSAAHALDLIAQRLDPAHLDKTGRLGRAALLVNTSLSLDAVLHDALRLAVEAMDAQRGFLILREGRRVAASLAAGRGDEAASGEPSGAIVGRALQGEAVFTGSHATGPPLFERCDAGAGATSSVACVPLRVRDEVFGVLYLDSCERTDLFARDDRDMLESFAYHVALAIENARMFEAEHERALRTSALQAFQTRILEAIASGVITLSPERVITTFNRAAETTFGIASDEMNGRVASALTKLVPKFPELLETFFKSGAVQLRAEVRARRSDDRILTLELQLSPLESPEGKGVAMVVTDVTKQRGLEVAHEAQTRKSELIEASFSRYLAPHVVKSLMNDPAALRLGGERTRATMFFADIRGFTSLAMRLPAERVVEILNTYFDEAVKIVFGHDGMLDKFYGDGLMAVFGPPRVRSDDASRAVAAAIGLHDVVSRLGPRLNYPLRISVGIATGEVVAGHFGSAQRMDYTVIGDAVNLANGLQSAAPPGAIYCDAATIAAAGTIERPAQRLSARLKGRSEPVQAYAIYPDARDRPGSEA